MGQAEGANSGRTAVGSWTGDDSGSAANCAEAAPARDARVHAAASSCISGHTWSMSCASSKSFLASDPTVSSLKILG